MDLLDAVGQQQIWNSFATALGAKIREPRTIRGVSGLDHPVEALAEDDKNGRLILISAEASPRMAALMQADVQAAMPSIPVLVARPVIIDIGVLARRLLSPMAASRIPMTKVREFLSRYNTLPKDERQSEMNEYIGEAFLPVSTAFKNIALPTVNQVLDVVRQAAGLDWGVIIKALKEGSTEESLDLTSLYEIDNTRLDRQHGICPIPLYEFAERDWELLTEGRSTELRERLGQLDILQYFFPSPDQLALGLVDQGVSSEAAVVRSVRGSAELGHPLSKPELVPTLSDLAEVVKSLRDSGHVVEGEFGLEVSPAGSTVRSVIKVRPREGIVSKVLSRFNVNLSASPRDFLGH